MGSSSSVAKTSEFGHFTKAEDVAKRYSNNCTGKHVIITGETIYSFLLP
jgi:hypothetical protein